MIRKNNKFIYVFLLLIPLFSFCELGKSADKLYNEGLNDLSKGKTKSAYKLLSSACKKNPKNPEYHWAAAKAAQNQNDMFIHIKACWDNGLKNQNVLMQLAAVSFHSSNDQRVAYTMSLFNELPDSLKTENFRGDLFFYLNKPDSALSVWKSLEKKAADPLLTFKIASGYEKKGAYDSMFFYLNDCRKKNLLNSSSYTKLMSLRALQYDYAQVDSIYNEAAEKKLDDNSLKLEYASILILRNDLANARNLISGMIDTKTTDPLSKIRAAIITLYTHAIAGDNEGIKNTLKLTEPDTVLHKNVNMLADFYLSSDTSAGGVIDKIRKIHLSIPAEPFITLPYIHVLLKNKKFKEADTLYHQLPQVILASPPVSTDYAYVKFQLGEDDDAMKIINRLHENKIFSKKSLELFRDISFKKNLFEKSAAAQTFLENKFKDDVQIQYKGVLFALNKGKTDSAITLLNNLVKKYPDIPEFELLRINILLVNGKYEQVIEECDKSPAAEKSKANLLLIKARAYRKLQKNNEASEAFKSAISESKNNRPDITSEYATFLIETGKSSEAASILHNLISSHENKTAIDSSNLAILLNNFAWASAMASVTVDKSIIEAAKKAVELQPDNLNILDTYCMILLKCEKYKECIELLKNKNNIKNEPRLLIYLGQAYEKSSEKNKAVRYYIDALAIKDTVGKMPLQISRDKLNSHIATFQSEK